MILMHGWPELGLSWRHQIAPLVDAGYTVAVPDMRGYGKSSKPSEVGAYKLDLHADDMASIADALGFETWISIGHDWGAPVAWRTALRFPDRVRGVIALSVPYTPPPPMPTIEIRRQMYADRFFYVTYFQDVGPVEAELEKDVRASLKQIFFSLSGDAPKDDWIAYRDPGAPMLPGLSQPPAGPLSFMTDQELDAYAAAYREGGFFGPVSWYRNFEADFEDTRKYLPGHVLQPCAFICGEKEIVLSMYPGVREIMREFVADLRLDEMIPEAGHWIQQERPQEVNRMILDFMRTLQV
ncbi:MAG: alpha/beta hydrolase [Hyphomonas sp.]|nr:alpha/beta hydrolase [Hyphomonas sp.]